VSRTGAHVAPKRCNSIFAFLHCHCLMWPPPAYNQTAVDGFRKKGLSTEELLVFQHIEKSGNMGGSAVQDVGSVTLHPCPTHLRCALRE
jgi:hypothetical protein